VSTVDRLLESIREVVVLGSEMKRLNADIRDLALEVRDHERRLIRIETLIEVAGMRPGGAERLAGPES
jgi:hypothetical protein